MKHSRAELGRTRAAVLVAAVIIAAGATLLGLGRESHRAGRTRGTTALEDSLHGRGGYHPQSSRTRRAAASMISARVTDPGGVAVAGAQVLSRQDVDADDVTSTTDENGACAIPVRRSLPFLYLRGSGGGFPLQNLGVVRSFEEGVTLVLYPARSVRGRVSSGAGEAVADASVQMQVASGPLSGKLFRASTGSDGSFEFRSIPPSVASLRVHVSASKRGGACVMRYKSLPGVGDAFLDLRLEPTVVVRGHVVSETRTPLEGAKVRISFSQIGPPGREPFLALRRTNRAGRFEFPGVPRSVLLDGMARLYVRTDSHAAHYGLMPPEGEVLELLCVLPRCSRIRGRLVDGNGDPIAGARLRARQAGSGLRRFAGVASLAHSDPGEEARATTNDDGVFEFEGLPVVPPTPAVPDAPENTRYLIDWDPLMRGGGNRPPLPQTVVQARPGQEVWVEIRAPSLKMQLTVTVSARDGSPVPWADVQVVQGFWSASATTKENGVCRLALYSDTDVAVHCYSAVHGRRRQTRRISKLDLESPVRFVVDPPVELSGLVVFGSGEPVRDARVRIDGTHRSAAVEAASGRFRLLAPSERKWNLTVSRANSGQRAVAQAEGVAPGVPIRIVVRDGHELFGRITGAALTGVKVVLERTATGEQLVVRPDREGRFRFTNVSRGHYELGFRAGDLDAPRRPIRIPEDSRSSVDLHVESGSRVQGRVRDAGNTLPLRLLLFDARTGLLVTPKPVIVGRDGLVRQGRMIASGTYRTVILGLSAKAFPYDRVFSGAAGTLDLSCRLVNAGSLTLESPVGSCRVMVRHGSSGLPLHVKIPARGKIQLSLPIGPYEVRFRGKGFSVTLEPGSSQTLRFSDEKD